jgi:hypothetical protein
MRQDEGHTIPRGYISRHTHCQGRPGKTKIQGIETIALRGGIMLQGNKEASLLDAGRMVRDHRASTSEGNDRCGAPVTGLTSRQGLPSGMAAPGRMATPSQPSRQEGMDGMDMLETMGIRMCWISLLHSLWSTSNSSSLTQIVN